MELKQFGRKAFSVVGLQVTEDNMAEVAEWCNGTVEAVDNGITYIKVPVHRPVNEKQSKAFVTDWVLKSPTGFKVYVDRAFRNSFEEEPQQPKRRNVFEQADEVQAIVDEANKQVPDENVVEGQCDACGFVKQLTVIDKDRKVCRKCIKELEIEEPTTREALGFAQPKNLMEA